jgi:hypothetical protein
MNDSELKSKLAAWKLAPAPEQTRSRAEWHALTAYRNRTTSPAGAKSPVPPSRIAWKILTVSVALGCLVLVTLLTLRPAADSPLENPVPLLTELEDFFQGRLTAVIQHNGELDLQLTEEPVSHPTDQRVAVRIEWQNEHFLILTYSGNSVCLETTAGRLCVTPLINGAGEVILLGESGLLDHQPGLRAEARTLQGT